VKSSYTFIYIDILIMKLSILSLAPLFLAASSNALSISPGVVSKTAGWQFDQISPKQRIEGLTRHAFGFNDLTRDTVQVAMQSPSGRPITSEVNLWLGPDYTPFQLKCHSEDGKNFPVQTLVGTKKYAVNVEVKNTGPYTHPLNAACSYAVSPLAEASKEIQYEEGTYIEGGAVKMQPFPPEIDQLQVLLKTDGKQLKAKIELLNGPNNVKQEFEVYASNGAATSLFIVFETPGAGNAIRVKNLASLEYPLDMHYRASETSLPVPAEGLTQWNN
jgi:hypothetical protein